MTRLTLLLNNFSSNTTRLIFGWVLCLCVVLVFTGCSAPLLLDNGRLQLTSLDRLDESNLQLDLDTTQAIYRLDDLNTLTVLLVQGPEEAPQRVIELRMFWKARAGLTPVDRTATNSVVRYFEFRDDIAEPKSLGLYAGAGFLRLQDDPASGRVEGTLWDSDLRLSDRSARFTDRIGRGVLAGSFSARRDDAGVTRVMHTLNQLVTERLGYPRLVRADAATSDSI